MKLDLRGKLNQINHFYSKEEKPWTSQKNAPDIFDNFCLDLVFSKTPKNKKLQNTSILCQDKKVYFERI